MNYLNANFERLKKYFVAHAEEIELFSQENTINPPNINFYQESMSLKTNELEKILKDHSIDCQFHADIAVIYLIYKEGLFNKREEVIDRINQLIDRNKADKKYYSKHYPDYKKQVERVPVPNPERHLENFFTLSLYYYLTKEQILNKEKSYQFILDFLQIAGVKSYTDQQLYALTKNIRRNLKKYPFPGYWK